MFPDSVTRSSSPLPTQGAHQGGPPSPEEQRGGGPPSTEQRRVGGAPSTEEQRRSSCPAGHGRNAGNAEAVGTAEVPTPRGPRQSRSLYSNLKRKSDCGRLGSIPSPATLVTTSFLAQAPTSHRLLCLGRRCAGQSTLTDCTARSHRAPVLLSKNK